MKHNDKIIHFLERLFFILLLSFYSFNTFSNSVVINHEIEIEDISHTLLFFKDLESKLGVKDIINRLNEFKISGKKITNLGTTSATHWAICTFENQSDNTAFLLQLESPLLDELEVYVLGNEKTFQLIYNFDIKQSKYNRKYNYPYHTFDIIIHKGESKKILFKLKSNKELIVPLSIGSQKGILEAKNKKDVIFGVFAGIVLIMFLYNLFIYFSVRDKSYLFYVIYILFLGITQLILHGYDFQYLYFMPWLAERSVYFSGALVGIAVVLFMMSFLNTKQSVPKLHRFLYLIIVSDIVAIILAFFRFFNFSYQLIDITAGIGSLYVLFIAVKLSMEGNRSAKLFLTAWSIFFIGVIIFVLRNQGVLPYNNFTNYTMFAGAAIESLLLSFALADRINIMQVENEETQRKIVDVLNENQKIISEQNIVLEQKVTDRTKSLNETLDNLKQTQSQLVEAEKMASLGQLTAGIAHEVNNSINFITSNIFPLREDIKDLKAILSKYADINSETNLPKKLAEIEQLKEELQYDYLLEELDGIIRGIEDGAKRTAEIVSGLRNFSRLDEGDLKMADINEGINSTLLLIKSKLKGIKLIKKLEKLPQIECYPGKLNQLILNLVDNAIYAIKKKEISHSEGEISISTFKEDNSVVLIIKDNGIGMNEDTKQKLFNPFFTTKEVGEGTGLGLSIVFGIIEMHQAKIEVTTEIGLGTEFKIVLPIIRNAISK